MNVIHLMVGIQRGIIVWEPLIKGRKMGGRMVDPETSYDLEVGQV